MIITHEINMDLTHRGEMPVLEAVQDDKYTRNLRLNLSARGTPWVPPDGITGVVRFCKADGKGGEYDTLPDGRRAFSVTESGVLVALAPQMLTLPGLVQMEVRLIRDEAVLTTFRVILHVQPNLREQIVGSEDYYRVEGFLKRSGWEPGMLLGTDEKGDVTAVPPPECQGTTEAEVQEIIAGYLEENPIEGGVSEEEVGQAIERYLTENPMGGGATAAQLAQIQKNTADIAAIPVFVDDEGYTDIGGLRKMTALAFSRAGNSITVSATLQGNQNHVSVVTVDDRDYPTGIATEDVNCAVAWEGFDG